MNKKTILITGAKGSLGRSIPNIKGYRVIRVSKKDLDITDFVAVEKFCAKHRPSVIIHLASVVDGYSDKGWMYNVNVTSTVNLLKVAQFYGLEKFIFTSSSAVYSQSELMPTKEDENVCPRNFYGETKLIAENELIKHSECDLVIFRIFNLYGSGFENSVVNRIMRKDKGLCLYNRFYRDYIHVSEVIKFLLMAVEMDVSGVFNLGSGVSRDIDSLLLDMGCRFDLKDGSDSFSWADINKLYMVFGEKPSDRIVLNSKLNLKKFLNSFFNNFKLEVTKTS